MEQQKPKLSLVFGQLPTPEEVDQFMVIQNQFNVRVIASHSICSFISQTSYFQDLECVALPDYNDNPSYLPGLENALQGSDVVVVKDRLGIYAYQVVKAKWRHRFRLAVWIDNVVTLPQESNADLRAVRREIAQGADLFLTTSKAVVAMLEIEGIESSRIAVIKPFLSAKPAITAEDRRQYRQALGLTDGSFLIAHIGRIEWEEGLADLASAVKAACLRQPSFARRAKIAFCGIGSYAPELRNLFVSLGIDDKVLYLAPTRVSIEHLLHGADAMFLGRLSTPDRIDADPYPFLRAMMNRLPIIANRSPAVDETCQKHRLDYCQGLAGKLASTLIKTCDQAGLRHDVADKAWHLANQQFTETRARDTMTEVFAGLIAQQHVKAADGTIEILIQDIEQKIAGRQYLAAIDIIDSVFRQDNIPLHHKSHLYRLVGDSFAKLGDNEGAKDAYIHAIELDPYSAKAYIGLGTVGLVKRSYDIAVLHFQKSVSLAPHDEMANLGLGLAFQGMSEAHEATRWVAKALDINPDNTVAIFTLVKLAHESDQMAAAERALRRYVARHPNDYNMVYTLGGILFKLSHYDEVIELMESIIKVDPLDARAHSLIKEAQKVREQRAPASSSNA